MLLYSLLWYIFVPARVSALSFSLSLSFFHLPFLPSSLKDTMAVAVLFGSISQELMRCFLLIGYYMTVKLIAGGDIGENAAIPINDISSALAMGVGFGGMHVLMMLGSIVAASDSDAVLFSNSCESVPQLYVLAAEGFGFFLLDLSFMFVGMLSMHAYKRKRNTFRLFWVGITVVHYLVACLVWL